jgi:hypothetical protein
MDSDAGDKFNVVPGDCRTIEVLEHSQENVDLQECAGDDANSMHLNLRVSGLALEMRTKTAVNQQIIELGTRLSVVLEQLADAQSKLEQAYLRIGYLEAKLEEYQ